MFMLEFKTEEEFIQYVQENILFTPEVLELLECTRQALNQAGKPKPIKHIGRNAIYLKAHVLERQEELKISRVKYGKKNES